MGKALVATLGFDERHVIRSLLAIGMEGVEYIVLLIPDWDIDERTSRAIDKIKEIASLAGVSRDNVVLERIHVEDFWSSIASIVKVFIEYYKAGVEEFMLSLGGGLRALIIEVYTATLFLPDYIASNTTVRIDLEPKNLSVIIKRDDIPLRIESIPSPQEVDVLKALHSKPEPLTSLSKKLDIPKSTLWKILKRLEKNKLILRSGNIYEVTSLGKVILEIYSRAYK